jgi:hypothetical protein
MCHYVWPGLSKDIMSYIQVCAPCNHAKLIDISLDESVDTWGFSGDGAETTDVIMHWPKKKSSRSETHTAVTNACINDFLRGTSPPSLLINKAMYKSVVP